MTWKNVDIASVCFEAKQRDPRKEPENEFVYVDISSVDNQAKRISGTNRMRGKDAPSRARKEICSGDILVSTVRPNLNAVALVPRSLDGEIASTGFCVLRSNPELIVNRYLFYHTTTPEFVRRLNRMATGASYPTVSDMVVKNTPIPLPPLSIQNRIVAILDSADAAREKRRQANRLTDQFLQSAFLEMFGDPVRNSKNCKTQKVEYLCDLVRGSSPRPKSDRRFYGGSIPRLMIEDISRDGMFVTPTIDSLTELGAKQSRYMKAGDVVMAVSGAVGLSAILKSDACIHDGFVGFRNLSPRLLPAFFLYHLFFVRSTNATRAPGAIWKNLNTDQVKRWEIPIPPMGLQKEFLILLEKVESLKLMQKTSECEIDNLFNSLMQRAFQGELVQ